MNTTKKTRSIVVVGRRWFDRVNGNTYYSAEIFVNGEKAHKIDYAYGYGDQYLWDSFDWLEANGFISREKHSNGATEAPFTFRVRTGVSLVYSVLDVRRKRDL